jgi:hypothetical protein
VENRPENFTRAGVTGKVPQIVRASRGGRGRKIGKVAGHKRKHVSHLKAQGAISPKAAARHGI